MGSEASTLQRDIHVDRPAVETTDFWTLYNAVLLHDGLAAAAASPTATTGAGGDSAANETNAHHTRPSTPVSMFQGEPIVAGQLWSSTSPLERSARNLMVYRHPAILRFIKSSCTASAGGAAASTSRGSQTFLVTERCHPLSVADLSTHSDLQTRLGLRSVCAALQFLVERAAARHLNVSLPVVYVTPSGAWRLGGFEQVWKAGEMTARLLEMAQPFRCRRAIDATAEKRSATAENAEQYAFAVLCEEVLKARHADEGEFEIDVRVKNRL